MYDKYIFKVKVSFVLFQEYNLFDRTDVSLAIEHVNKCIPLTIGSWQTFSTAETPQNHRTV